jgi:flavin-dependent dehydrogenase
MTGPRTGPRTGPITVPGPSSRKEIELAVADHARSSHSEGTVDHQLYEDMIVGGGIAGSALAILLAEAGRRVTLLERSAGPHHSVCGEFLSPEAIVYLRALGIDPLALGAQPITHVRLAARELIAETRLPRPALSLTRCTLDEALRTRAAEAGAVVQRGTNVERLTRSGDQWQAECVQSGGRRAVLFASRAYLATGKYDLRGWARRAGTDRTADAYPAPSDLRQSNVLSSAQHAKGSLTQPPGQKEHRMQAESSGTNGQPGTDGRPAPWSLQTNLVAFKMYFHLDPAQHAALAEHVELILFPGGYTGLQTVEGGAANLCTLLTRDRLRSLGGWPAVLDHMQQSSPHLARRLAGAKPLLDRSLALSSIPYGYRGPSTLPPDSPWRLGDQAAVIPSFSGDGMSIALHTAHAAARLSLQGARPADLHACLRRELGQQVRLATALSQAMVRLPLLAHAARLWPGILHPIFNATRVPESVLLTELRVSAS